MRPRAPASLVLALATALALTARAQDAPRTDPFATPEAVRRARGLESGGVGPIGSRSVLAALPGLAVQGTLEVVGRPAAAILLVGEATRIVRVGDRVTLVRDGVDVSLDVVAIARGALTLRAGGEQGPLLVLR